MLRRRYVEFILTTSRDIPIHNSRHVSDTCIHIGIVDIVSINRQEKDETENEK